LKELTLRIIVTVIRVEILVTSAPTTYRDRRPNSELFIDVGHLPTHPETLKTTTGRSGDPLGCRIAQYDLANGNEASENKYCEYKLYTMNTRRLLRNHRDQDTAYSCQAVDESDYDPHWKDRLLPGNQEIYGRASEQARLLHEQYIETSARDIATCCAERGAPGPRIRRPPGRTPAPSPRQGNSRITDTDGARHLTVTGFNLLVERARILRLSQGEKVSPPACLTDRAIGRTVSPTGDSSPSAYPHRPRIQGRRRSPILDTTVDEYTNTSPPPVSHCDAATKLEPYLERMTKVLERLELLIHRLPQEVTPVPTPINPTQQTTVRYNMEAYRREAEVPLQPNPDTVGSDGFDSASSRGATPRGPSPQWEGTAGTSLSAPCEGSSSDEMES